MAERVKHHVSHYQPFLDRLHAGPAMVSDCLWAMEEARQMLDAARATLCRLGYLEPALDAAKLTESIAQLADEVRP